MRKQHTFWKIAWSIYPVILRCKNSLIVLCDSCEKVFVLKSFLIVWYRNQYMLALNVIIECPTYSPYPPQIFGSQCYETSGWCSDVWIIVESKTVQRSAEWSRSTHVSSLSNAGQEHSPGEQSECWDSHQIRPVQSVRGSQASDRFNER